MYCVFKRGANKVTFQGSSFWITLQKINMIIIRLMHLFEDEICLFNGYSRDLADCIPTGY